MVKGATLPKCRDLLEIVGETDLTITRLEIRDLTGDEV